MRLGFTHRSRWPWVLLIGVWVLPLSACGPTKLTIKNDIPPLLMPPLPLAMGVRLPKTFTGYTQKETAEGREWLIALGVAQADAMKRVTSAMFQSTVVLGDHAPGDAATIAAHKLSAIIEPSLDSYVYLLPSPNGADFYSATIGYKVNLEATDGTVLGSWIYEGYGSAPSRGLGDAAGVELVTQLAIRDACANMAAHLPDQELIRNLLAPETPAPAAEPSAPAPPSSTEAPAPDASKPATPPAEISITKPAPAAGSQSPAGSTETAAPAPTPPASAPPPATTPPATPETTPTPAPAARDAQPLSGT